MIQSYKVASSLLIVMLLWVGNIYGQVPDTAWTQTFGSANNDWGMDVHQTSDGGYIIVGFTFSFGTGTYESDNFNSYPSSVHTDPTYVLLDGYGNWSSIQWNIMRDAPPVVGNFIVVRTHPPGPDNHATYNLNAPDSITSLAVGFKYFEQRRAELYVYLSPDNISWTDVTSEFGFGLPNAVSQIDVYADLTSYVTGYGLDAYIRFETDCWSGDYWMVNVNDFWATTVQADAYLIKTDANGNTEWTVAHGDTGSYYGYGVQQTSDGGYVVVGTSYPTDTSQGEVWLLKTDENGNELWSKIYGGSARDYGYAVQQTMDGGFIIAGATSSYGAGDFDFWLLKTDSNGDLVWTETYGGTAGDYGYSVQQTSDGGYVVAGVTYSFGAGENDAWLVRTGPNGNTLWTKTYGDPRWNNGYSVQQISDGGFIICGKNYPIDPPVDEVWLIRTDEDGNELWSRTYGGIYGDGGWCAQETSDGGFIATGFSYSFGADGDNVYLVKTDTLGDTLWTTTHGGDAAERCYSVKQTSDGGYVAVGVTNSYGIGEYDVWLIRISGQTGTIVGWVTDQYNGQPIADAILDLYNASADTLFASTTTDNEGYYEFSYYIADSDTHWLTVDEEYSVWIVLPEGYRTHDATSKNAVVPDTVNFTAYIQGGSYARSMGYWKHQVNMVLKGKVHDYTETDLLEFLDTIHDKWDYFDNVLTMEDMKDIFKANSCMADRAAKHLLALELNVVSGKLYEGALIDLVDLSDVTTVGEAILECEGILLDFNATDEDYERAKDIAEMLNNMEGFVGGGPQLFDIGSPTTPFNLLQNYPNPFTSTTSIPYALYKEAHVTLKIYNAAGQLVNTLVDQVLESGYYTTEWDRKDRFGHQVPTGIYFYRLSADEFISVKKMTIVH